MNGAGGSPESTDLESLSFEEAYRRLSEMAEFLEDGGVSLSEAVARYEEGMQLVRLCNRLLDEAELRISNINDSAANDSVPEPDEEELVDEDDLPF